MDSFASTAIYLASSLTTAQTPRTVALLPIAAVANAVPAVRQDLVVTADVPASANPFVAARRRGAKSLAEAIADEVRRDALGGPADDAGSASSFDSDGVSRDDPDLSEDVTAAHAARIAVIRRRIDDVRLEEPSAAALLAGLSTKLRMALAARRLAVAREAIGHLALECPAGPDTCRAEPSVAATDVADHRDAGRARPHRSTASRHRPPAVVLATSRSVQDGTTATARSTGAGIRPVADVHRDLPHRMSDGLGRGDIRLAGPGLPATRPALRHGLGGHGAGEVAAGDASAHARRLLAAARRLLEDEGAHHPRPDVKLAGLLHWDGSETWSLVDYPRSAA